MACTAKSACWTSQDDENLKPTYYFDEGHYPHTNPVNKPVVTEQEQPSKPSVDYALRDKSENAKNGYNGQCDFIMALWRDGINYMNAVNRACRWLKVFNELNGIEECK